MRSGLNADPAFWAGHDPEPDIAIFRIELSKKLEKSSGNGCTFSLMSAETLSHAENR
jgi:hypothetical protein